MAQERGAQASLCPPCPREPDPVCVVSTAGEAMEQTRQRLDAESMGCPPVWTQSGHPHQRAGQSLAPKGKGLRWKPQVWLSGPVGVQHTPGTLDTAPPRRTAETPGCPHPGAGCLHTWVVRASAAGKGVGWTMSPCQSCLAP